MKRSPFRVRLEIPNRKGQLVRAHMVKADMIRSRGEITSLVAGCPATYATLKDKHEPLVGLNLKRCIKP